MVAILMFCGICLGGRAILAILRYSARQLEHDKE